MIRKLIALLLVAIGSTSPIVAMAGAPNCYTHTAGPYCSYSGTVKKAYINSGNIILFYFDTALDLSLPAGVGISGITRAAAALISMTEKPDFAKTAYATMLAAQARGATVSIQMRGSQSGYLKIDRIWINE